MKYHESVMEDEVFKFMIPQKEQKFIDCTLGDGGHTLRFLEKGAYVLGIELYKPAFVRALERIDKSGYASHFIGINDNFKNIMYIAQKYNFNGVNGIIFDLGYSSYEYDESTLGISFKKNNPLDMRLDPHANVTAADLLNSLPKYQLEKIIREYGGEKNANKYAQLIIDFRNKKKFYFTSDLADLIKNNTSFYYEDSRIHPATRTFQALRIAVNNEIENLHDALPRAAQLLLPGGRMVVISFHSLEDKQAKDLGLNVQPTLKQVTKKPVVPGRHEMERNIRVRSAKMRVYERL